MKTIFIKNKRGFTLIETLFYIALFAILTLAVMNSLIVMTKAFRETAIQTDLSQSAFVLERISREIRQANTISSISSNDLILNTTNELGDAKLVRFFFTGGNAQFFENGVHTGNLNTGNVVVTGLSFTQITTSTGQAVKVVLSVRSTRDSTGRVESFYGTVVLRGGY